MIDIRIKVAGNVKDLGIINETKASVEEEAFSHELGKVIYAVESMGYSFVTDDVYQKAIENYNNISIDSRYSRIYAVDVEGLTMEIAVRKMV